MKWFYIIAFALVGLLALAPYYLLRPEKAGRFEGKVVGYNIYMAKIKSIDPATCGDTSSASIQGYFYESLYGYHYLKRPIELIPVLADGMPEVSSDGKVYTIRIRPGLRYARNPAFGYEPDGRTPRTRDVRAEDFVLAFKRVGDFHLSTDLSLAFVQDQIVDMQDYHDRTRVYHKGDFSRYDKEPLAGVEAVDEHTLRIHLTRPFPQLLYVLAINCYAPVPREVIDYHLSTRPDGKGGRQPIPLNDRSPEILNNEAAVGTGPYVLTEFVRGGSITMERNEEYREELYPAEGAPGDREAGLLADAGQRVPLVDAWHLTYVAESNPAWMLFLARQRDSSGVPREVYQSVITPTKELTEQWRQKGIRLLKETDPSVYWYAFNMDDPVIGKSKSLRQALCLAYNVEEHIDVLINGRGKRAISVIPSEFEGHDEAGAGPYARLDLAAAHRKIADAKAELAAAGVIAPGQDIPTLTLDLGDTGEEARRQAEFAQSQFKKIGVTLKIELNDWPTLQAKVHNKQCQIYGMGWHADYPDPENFLQLYYSKNIDRGTNNTNYRNPGFDRLYEQAALLMPSPQRTELYVQMLRMLSEDCPVLLLVEYVGYNLVYDWVHNLKPHPIGYGFAKYIRIDADARRKAGGR